MVGRYVDVELELKCLMEKVVGVTEVHPRDLGVDLSIPTIGVMNVVTEVIMLEIAVNINAVGVAVDVAGPVQDLAQEAAIEDHDHEAIPVQEVDLSIVHDQDQFREEVEAVHAQLIKIPDLGRVPGVIRLVNKMAILIIKISVIFNFLSCVLIRFFL